ncbi:RNA polymerase subunit sigma-70 [Salipaludibacillus neizhouensis]|uniref:RNA polymerase subunit sigma-70 n=1 Tax=Salipaludibacillus neizhouensis TaxID=885475 RepID=A0A3A9K3M7_9BACI|nr:sugar-binding transcriptional regulator [Salipaludibacillus neizhouensis]RKL67247.1 RNA polymerase subunit sigma-70 [Salipaludibacillus neizhouensis]
MEKSKKSQLIEAAKMYYLYDYNQSKIAEKLNVSRPTVSRLLYRAKAEGIVEIKVNDTEEDSDQLAEIIQHRYNLKRVIVVDTPEEDDQRIKQYLGQQAADFLDSIIEDNEIIGVTWGTTMYQVAKELKPKKMNNVRIVQMKGGVSHSETNTHANEILYMFGQAFHTIPHHLPLPAIVDHVVVKQAMEADRYIKNILELGQKATIAMYTVGTVKTESLLFQLGYFKGEDTQLISEKSVGDISSRFFDGTGEICSKELNSRTVGIELSELRKKKYSILIAGGAHKLAGIRGALTGKYANVLVTDVHTAKELAKENKG